MNRTRNSTILFEGVLDKILSETQPTVTQSGYLAIDDQQVAVTPLLHFNRVIYICKGKARVIRKNKILETPTGYVLHLEENEELMIDYDHLPFEAYYINFKLINIIQDSHDHLMRFIPDGIIKDVNNILLIRFKEIIDVAEQGGIANYFKVKSMFNILLVDALRVEESTRKELQDLSNKPSNTQHLYNAANDYIINNLRTAWKVKNLAKHLNISEAYLYQIFTKHAGRSPQSFLTDYRIQVAKDFLKYDNQTIKDVSYRLGFGSPNHFSAYFKLNVGITPQDYRRALKV